MAPRQSAAGKGPKVYDGNKKKCNCPIHKGAFVPLSHFWVFKSGRRKGQPFSQCIEGTKLQRGRKPELSGFIDLARVKFIFIELERRLGRAEAARRCGFSANFYPRLDSGKYKVMRKARVARAILVLRDVRERDEVRHRDSIKRGASARGEIEKKPTTRKDYYYPTGDHDVETRRNYRRTHVEQERETERRRRRGLTPARK